MGTLPSTIRRLQILTTLFSVKVVELDEICRQQQVDDGCFESIKLGSSKGGHADNTTTSWQPMRFSVRSLELKSEQQ